MTRGGDCLGPDPFPCPYSAAERAEFADDRPPNGYDPDGANPIIDAGEDDEPIPPRRWLQGTTFCRGFISALTGAGAAGKTAIRYLQYVAQATGRPLAGEHVHARCPVLIVCLEDGINEVRRRIRALRLHYSIPADELKGRLFYWAPSGHKLMETDARGQRITGNLDGELRDLIRPRNIGLIGIDPFVKSHGCDENDNNAVDAVCILLSRIATDFDCAVDLLQHHRKGALSPGDADSGRGASALKDAARLVRTATPMTEDEAETFGIVGDDRANLVRLDDAKINLAPRATAARWFKLVGIALGNRTDDYPHGDIIQAAEPWSPPELWSGVSTATFNAILDEIDAGLPGAPSLTRGALWTVPHGVSSSSISTELRPRPAKSSEPGSRTACSPSPTTAMRKTAKTEKASASTTPSDPDDVRHHYKIGGAPLAQIGVRHHRSVPKGKPVAQTPRHPAVHSGAPVAQ